MVVNKRKTLKEDTWVNAMQNNYDSNIEVTEVKDIEDEINATDKTTVVVDKDGDGKLNKKDFGQIGEALDRAVRANKVLIRRAEKNGYKKRYLPDSFENVLIVGPAGAGKTAIVKKWADDRGFRVLTKSAMELDMGDLGGVVAIDVEDKWTKNQEDKKNYENEVRRRKASRYSLDEFDELGEFGTPEDVESEDPNAGKYCILFLDEFNRASGAVRSSLLTLINNHVISDSDVKGGKRFLPAFLFTVAAVNPRSYADYIEPFDPAELGRFTVESVEYDPQFTLRHFKEIFGERIEDAKDFGDLEEAARLERALAIATRLLSHPDFHFATPEEEAASIEAEKDNGIGLGSLNPRSLELLLLMFDGTKDDFLKQFPKKCGYASLDVVKPILSSYRDIDVSKTLNQRGTGTTNNSKANSVFKSSELNSKLNDFLKNNPI